NISAPLDGSSVNIRVFFFSPASGDVIDERQEFPVILCSSLSLTSVSCALKDGQKWCLLCRFLLLLRRPGTRLCSWGSSTVKSVMIT
ncbi:hypothetical protein AMELA_G00243130, partial [Ameiurus melas]